MVAHEEKLVSFKHPPIVETVLGVQFAPILKLTGGYIGWYWRTVLGESWVKAVEVPFLLDQYERFGQQLPWNFPSHQLTVSLPNRLQLIHETDDRVIQVQNSRFLLNWRKRAEAYPLYEIIRDEFIREYLAFARFLEDADLGVPAPNQWEVTYINHIPRGDLWESPADWHKVFPGIVPRLANTATTKAESLSVDLHFELVPELGRLHVSCKHGIIPDDGGELLVLEFTARGPVKAGDPTAIERGLQLGHQSIVKAFVAFASEQALDSWGMQWS